MNDIFDVETGDLPLGKRIACARRAAGLTQEELGERIGSPKNSVSEWERGLRQPRIEILVRIADAIGLTVDQLIRGDLTAERHVSELEVLAGHIEAVKASVQDAAAALRRAVEQAVLEGRTYEDVIDALASIRVAEREVEEFPDLSDD